MNHEMVSSPIERRAWEILATVPDPEIPVISIVDLGIIRNVECVRGPDSDSLVVTVTPTYSGCPATEVISGAICRALQEADLPKIHIKTQLAPPWTTDWLSDTGRTKLRQYGIAPPVGRASEQVIDLKQLTAVSTPSRLIPCPRCDSKQTRKVSEFGSTPCKALYQCEACKEPFDYFKCH